MEFINTWRGLRLRSEMRRQLFIQRRVNLRDFQQKMFVEIQLLSKHKTEIGRFKEPRLVQERTNLILLNVKPGTRGQVTCSSLYFSQKLLSK